MSRWNGRRWGLVIGSVLVILGAVVVAIYAGLYNIAADVPHTQPVYWLLETAREHSVAARARDVVVPNNLDDANRISRGAGGELIIGVQRNALGVFADTRSASGRVTMHAILPSVQRRLKRQTFVCTGNQTAPLSIHV
jgi:hypothetical protein